MWPLFAAALAFWDYDPAWTEAHPRDLDAIARAVAPDVAVMFPSLRGPTYNASFRNPCFNDGARGQRLRCLPAFYVVGGFQCGARDLTLRLAKSPDLAKLRFSNWWTNPKDGDWTKFVDSFAQATASIQQHPSSMLAFSANQAMLCFTWAENKRVHHRYSDTVVECWRECRQGTPPAQYAAACRDKKYKLDHCMRRAYEADAASAIRPLGEELTLPRLMARAHGPRVKIVAVLRNPTDRLWSAFFKHRQFPKQYGDSLAGFVAYFDEQSLAYARCVKRYSVRKCVMRFESLGQGWQELFYHCDQILKSIYSVFVEEWIDALGRRALHVERSEDYFSGIDGRRRVLRRVGAFVGLQLDDGLVDSMASSKPKPGARSPGFKPSWQMPADVRARVSAFFAPRNADLARLLDDEAYADWPVYRPWTPSGQPHR